VTISREDEDAVRRILHEQVADVHASEDLIDRVQAEPRRRTAARRIAVSAATIAVAGCAVGVAFAVGGSRNTQHTPVAGPPIACPAPASLPSRWEVGGVLAKPTVAGATHSLLPGSPIAAVSCAVSGTGGSTRLTADELAATVAALKSPPRFSSPVAGACTTDDQAYRPLYLVFEYADGAQLTVVGYAVDGCNGKGPASWVVSNGSWRNTVQSPALDALGA
jgi:hypothetical protein